MADLGKLPLEAVLNEVLVLLKHANGLVALPQVKQALLSLQDVVLATERLVQHADSLVALPRSSGRCYPCRTSCSPLIACCSMLMPRCHRWGPSWQGPPTRSALPGGCPEAPAER